MRTWATAPCAACSSAAPPNRPHWNQKLGLDPEKRFKAASARRTLATVGDQYTEPLE